MCFHRLFFRRMYIQHEEHIECVSHRYVRSENIQLFNEGNPAWKSRLHVSTCCLPEDLQEFRKCPPQFAAHQNVKQIRLPCVVLTICTGFALERYPKSTVLQNGVWRTPTHSPWSSLAHRGWPTCALSHGVDLYTHAYLVCPHLTPVSRFARVSGLRV